MDLSWLYTRPAYAAQKNSRQFMGPENRYTADVRAARLKNDFTHVGSRLDGNRRQAQTIDAVMNNTYDSIPTDIEYRNIPTQVPAEVVVPTVNDPEAERMKRKYHVDPETLMTQLLGAWQTSHNPEEKAALKSAIEEMSAQYKYMSSVRRNTIARQETPYKPHAASKKAEKYYPMADKAGKMWRDFILEAGTAPEAEDQNYALQDEMPTPEQLGTMAWTRNRDRDPKDPIMSRFHTLQFETDLAQGSYMDDDGLHTYFITRRY
mmetsp:Transcript_39998/g.103307  ORF Transcript_39998/g.103307 Transcript_39998/m.103307 type:complete len:263 (-) Transcript_39998:1514-2302(-)